jgi:osmotically-inducible protein OsmY
MTHIMILTIIHITAPGMDIPTDDELRAVIARDLATSPFVDGERINVSVDNREVTLSGRVEDRSAMVDAVEIAYDAGALNVRNHLRKMEGEDRPWADMGDRELKREIQDELAYSPFVNEEQIRVNVRDGVAILYGGVENEGEIADAVENAYEAGAKRVKSRMWVDPELSDWD